MIAAAGGLLYVQFLRPPASAASAPSPVQDATGKIARERVRNVTGGSALVLPGDLALVEFTDFECPFCKRHATETLPALLTALGDDVRYISMHLPLPMHSQAIPAAIAAECAAEQGQFWEMHATLFENQPVLESAAATRFESYVVLLGLDGAKFEACRTSDAARARVDVDAAEAARLQVRSTPTVFIGRMRADGGVELLKRINGAASVEMFEAEVVKLSKER